MKVEVADDELDRMEFDPSYSGKFPVAILRKYQQRIQQIRAAESELNFRNSQSWHFEKLKGQRSHQHSIRLNDQYRLIVELIKGQSGTTVRIIGIEDYH